MITWIIIIVSMIIWILVPFKHYKTSFFYFFLILALSDPIRFGLFMTFKIAPMKMSPVIFLLVTFSLLDKKYFYISIITSLFYCFILFYLRISQNITMDISFIIQIVVALLILYRILHYLNENKAINLFHIILMTYLLINIFKYLAMMLNYEQGVASFYLGSFSQIIFGIIFFFINEKTKDFNLTSTTPENITLP
jgi:hypothetical protein